MSQQYKKKSTWQHTLSSSSSTSVVVASFFGSKSIYQKNRMKLGSQLDTKQFVAFRANRNWYVARRGVTKSNTHHCHTGRTRSKTYMNRKRVYTQTKIYKNLADTAKKKITFAFSYESNRKHALGQVVVINATAADDDDRKEKNPNILCSPQLQILQNSTIHSKFVNAMECSNEENQKKKKKQRILRKFTNI